VERISVGHKEEKGVGKHLVSHIVLDKRRLAHAVFWVPNKFDPGTMHSSGSRISYLHIYTLQTTLTAIM
jgi:hypothetical protein